MAKLKHFSGTPVSEGVRLEVGKYTVFAVRNADCDISVRLRREPRKLLRTCMRVPFLRGIVRLLRDIIRFLDGLNEASELHPHRPANGSKIQKKASRFLKIHPQTIGSWISAILIPLILFACLYAAPEGVEELLQDRFTLPRAWLNGIVCAVRVLGSLAGIGLICRLPVLRRLCMYKGALNKMINCYECRDALSVENARRYPIHTRRSEPVFLMGVLVISLIAFACIRTEHLIVTLLVRILTVLLSAALFNEPYSALEDADLTLPVRIVRTPLDLMQHMTALEPNSQMLETVLCAFQAVLDEPENKEVKPD